MPFNELEFSSGPKNYNFSIEGNASSIQFYPNMRYPNKDISYKITDCPLQKQGEMLQAFEILNNLTVLNFNPVASGEEITITCDERTRFEGNMFIAGEGGPTKIVKSGGFNVILSGMVLLLRESKCPNPNVGIHELLHALGFIHSNNKHNIMYNYTNCDQTIGAEIPNLIEELYETPAKPNLIVEDASARMSGRYLDLNFSVRNMGLADSNAAVIEIRMDDRLLKEIDLEALELGSGQIIGLSNLFVSRFDEGKLELEIVYDYPELYKEDNTLLLVLKK